MKLAFRLLVVLALFVLVVIIICVMALGQGTGKEPSVNSTPASINGEEDQTEKLLPDPLRHGQYPNNQSDLWIQISKEFIVRRLGYLDKRDKDNVSINLLSMQHKEKGQLPDIFLKIYHKNNHNVSCLPTSLELGSLNGSDTYVLYWICSPPLMPDQMVSVSNVTISTDKKCLNESDSILIRTVGDKPPKYNFGICLHKAFKDLTPKVIHDWVKLNMALGAEVIMLYLQMKAPQEVYNILLPYIKKGRVEVLDWQLEPPLTSVDSHYFGQTGVITECVWENMHKVKYLGLNDADEFFVPLKHNNIPKMLRELETIEEARRAGSFIFTNALIKGNKALPIVTKALNSKSCDGLSADSLPVYFNRSEYCLEKGNQSVKMIVKPDAVFTAWGHCLLSYRSDKYTKEYIVPDTMGLSYHYRPNWKGYKGCTTSTNETRIIQKFFTNITQCSVVVDYFTVIIITIIIIIIITPTVIVIITCVHKCITHYLLSGFSLSC